jgi:hypothetical protein
MIVVWVVLIIAVLFGSLLGYVAMKLPKAGFFALGFWLGIIISFMLNNAALSKIDTGDNHIMLWLTMSLFGILFGILSCYLHEHLTIVATSLIGAYCIIRPFGFFLGEVK